jgi:hypothetical protein
MATVACMAHAATRWGSDSLRASSPQCPRGARRPGKQTGLGACQGSQARLGGGWRRRGGVAASRGHPGVALASSRSSSAAAPGIVLFMATVGLSLAAASSGEPGHGEGHIRRCRGRGG